MQASDAYDVEAFDLKNCEKVLLDRFYGWLKPEQQSLTRLALQYRRGDYAGRFGSRPSKPEVNCDTLSNVRVTPIGPSRKRSYWISRSATRASVKSPSCCRGG